MFQTTTLIPELSLATMIFEISVLELENARGCHSLASRAPDYNFCLSRLNLFLVKKKNFT